MNKENCALKLVDEIIQYFSSISLHVSSTQCSSSGDTNCFNTASGNSHSMLVAEVCAGWKKTAACLIIPDGCIVLVQFETICLS